MSGYFTRKLFPLIVLAAGVVAAQSAPLRNNIPAIAKAANGAIVSIVMSDKDGKPIAQGSGFLVSNDGAIVTNYHVISEGISAIAKLPDGAFYVVDGVLASDKARDVAIIKAHGENFRTLTLGNSDRVQVGEEVVAIGNPLSLESTVSNGIVSGIRTAEEEGGKFLQVTAPISPGSSGGPLLNMVGEVVGITTLYLKGGENLNFAIPINDAKRLLQIRSSKIQALPNEAEPIKAQTHDGDVPSQSSLSGRDYYRQLYNASTFNVSMPMPDGTLELAGAYQDYSCFSDNAAHSGTFFTFKARGYDEVLGNALDKWYEFLNKSATQQMKEQSDIMDLRKKEIPYPYLNYLSTSEFNSKKADEQNLYKNPYLGKDIYDKGVKVDSVYYHWDGTSWLHMIYDSDSSKIIKTLHLSIEPTTMRYVETVKTPTGDTTSTDYGVCEEIKANVRVKK